MIGGLANFFANQQFGIAYLIGTIEASVIEVVPLQGCHIDLAIRIAFNVTSISISVERKLNFMIGGSVVFCEFMWIDPVLSGRIA